MEELKFVIPGDPKTKKNSQEIVYAHGRPLVVQNKRYKKYEADCAKHIPKIEKPIDYPVNIKAVFVRDTRRRVDRPNLEEALYDILVKYGVLVDDNRDIAAAGDGTRVYHDKVNPRVEVTITPMEGDYKQWKSET